jgi:hippurate hydrolase
MTSRIVTLFFVGLLMSLGADAQTQTTTSAPPIVEQVAAIYPEIEALYLDLHQHPELSMREQQTAAKLAERLKALGYQVTTGVGGAGIVTILKNGDGPTVMLRTDMDALPVEEKTGLPYASKATTKDSAGTTVSVMHACGHDVHIAFLQTRSTQATAGLD